MHSHSVARLDESDLPLAALASAAASRRQSLATDNSSGHVAAAGPAAASAQQEPQQPRNREGNEQAGGAPHLETAAQQEGVAGVAAGAFQGGSLLARADGSGTAVAEAAAVAPPQPGGQPAQWTPECEATAAAAAADPQPGSPARGILEKLAALKGLQKPSRSPSRSPEQLLPEAGEPPPPPPAQHAGDGAASEAAGAAAPAALQSAASWGRSNSRIHSLLQRQLHCGHSRLSVDGHAAEAGSPGRLAQAGVFDPRAPHQAESSADALASFEQAACRHARRASATDVLPSLEDGALQRRRATQTPSSGSGPGASQLSEADAAPKTLGARHSSAGSGSGFVIPSCPSGRVLQLAIHSTWGDVYYVGLAAVECFDAAGQPVVIRYGGVWFIRFSATTPMHCTCGQAPCVHWVLHATRACTQGSSA